MVDYTKYLEIKNLRFEQLVEIFRNKLDPNLNLIDYYGQCDTPNLQHFFLAEMIIKGHFVMTTNFDFLIERALQQTGVPDDEIVPVITKKDFEKDFSNPNELLKQGKKTIYKLHGSTKNVITGEETRDSLVATIQAFGSNKEGLNVFQVQPFQREAIINLTKNCSLVVMGYSGRDDFDIVPTLKILKNLKNIIWINYVYEDSGKEKIYEINKTDLDDFESHDKVNQILLEIRRMDNVEKVYRVDLNTTRMIKEIFKPVIKLSELGFNITPMNWLTTQENIESSNQIMKFQISFEIYYNLDMNEDAMRCAEKILKIAKDTKEESWKSVALNNIGSIYHVKGEYPEALKQYQKALTIFEQLGDLNGKASTINNIGIIYNKQGKYPEALKRCEEALTIFEQIGDLSGKARNLNNIGMIYKVQSNYPEALKRCNEALIIAVKMGDLWEKASYLNNIGEIFIDQGKYTEALKRCNEALIITEKLEDFSRKATILHNIGSIYYDKKNYLEALKRFEEALKIDEKMEDLSGKASTIISIGSIYYVQRDYPEALKQYEEALDILDQIGLGETSSANHTKKLITNIKTVLRYFL